MRLKNFINLSQQESREVFLWRNSEEISCFMKTKNISWEEHIAFLEKLKEEVTKQYFLVFDGEVAVGVVDFVDIQRGDSCEFGIYQNPNLKGYGKGLMEVVIKYAFETLKVKNPYACAFNENQKAISLYLKFGFILTKKDTKMSYFKCSQRVDCVD